MKIIKVSDKGQISIPKSIRELVKIKEGDELILFEVNGKILIEKLDKFKENFKDINRLVEKSLESVWNNKEDDIWNSYIKNGS